MVSEEKDYVFSKFFRFVCLQNVMLAKELEHMFVKRYYIAMNCTIQILKDKSTDEEAHPYC